MKFSLIKCFIVIFDTKIFKASEIHEVLQVSVQIIKPFFNEHKILLKIYDKIISLTYEHK